MGEMDRFLILFARIVLFLRLVNADTYSVKIGTEQHVNVVDSRFLSFTVDPKYLFSSSDKYNSKESVCMASSLTPAYIRIAGPSTSHMTFHNFTITFTDLALTDIDLDKPNLGLHSNKLNSQDELVVTHSQWQKFVQWAKSTGFDLVFALNNDEKTASGLWDPNTALNILTMAEKAKIGEIFWQLGYECRNQSIEEYLNDLQTLRVILETFAPTQPWRAAGGDVTPCLRTHSKSDFKDYVTLSDDMMDAVLLNGKSSAEEIERMSESDRQKLLKHLSISKTPLWLTETPQHLTETPQQLSELQRAADWMTSLGYSARNGFAVHFRELVEEELYNPTLSFYMALLFKNLVGERVLHAEMEAAQAALFAHCTTLRREPVPGAVTLFGVNMLAEPARFSVKLSRREDGGDIMQFILGHDSTGNIVVNGRAMYHEGDIRPVVKRVRPYKTLLISLPPKSFGFWVLANTKIDACHYTEDKNNTKKEFVEAISVTDEFDGDNSNNIKRKRSMSEKENDTDDVNLNVEIVNANDKLKTNHYGIKKRIDNLNNDLKIIHKAYETKFKKRDEDKVLNRSKRHALDDEDQKESESRKIRRIDLKQRQERKKKSDSNDSKPKISFIRKLLSFNARPNTTRPFRHERARKLPRFSKNKVSKRNSGHSAVKLVENLIDNLTKPDEQFTRTRRSIQSKNDFLSETNNKVNPLKNEIDVDNHDKMKLWKILRKIHEQLQELPSEEDENDESFSNEKKVFVKPKLSDDSAYIDYSEKSDHGLIKSTIGSVMSVLNDLTKNLKRFSNALSLLET